MTHAIQEIPAGDDLVSALHGASAVADGWIQAAGFVRDIELRFAVEGGVDPVRALRGRFALVSLMGPFGGPYAVVVANLGPDGPQMFGGVLVRGTSDGVRAMISAPPAIASAELLAPEVEPPPAARRAPPPIVVDPTRPKIPSFAAIVPNNPYRAGGAPLPVAQPLPATPPGRQVPSGGGQSAWAIAAAASAQLAEAHAAAESDLIPQAGDFVEHFAFGLCLVVQSDGERLKIRDLKGPGRVREVSLDMLRVMPPTMTEDDKRVFSLERRR